MEAGAVRNAPPRVVGARDHLQLGVAVVVVQVPARDVVLVAVDNADGPR